MQHYFRSKSSIKSKCDKNRGCAIFEKNDKKHARTHYIFVKNRLELTRISGIKFILN